MTRYACVRCGHPFAEHVYEESDEWTDCRNEDCDCEGYTDEPSEAQLRALYPAYPSLPEYEGDWAQHQRLHAR